MIKSFKHKGLKRFFQTGQTASIQADHVLKLRLRLAVIHAAVEISDIDIQRYDLHALKGTRKGIWSIAVTGNWRITFEFKDGDAYIINYEDYH
ncbi:type II toxin-antitoxin system RelE/ParE family toxin [Rosenbergiella epipactidis]|uniref:type II toxin-antitoxin system RelE/ParE family toxin n=1 Tax=Rosenbergiella epipactidis TaxID=1544694 RepID=UPI0020267FB8|nr:type II toxin-antitoxin system RelE/ParE family toxin [Rosenbergiella epipactidis]MCL9669494.1 type II toxin-antitoxin system RelE/ParE family toxin [Rosenbergiella epipactidis]